MWGGGVGRERMGRESRGGEEGGGRVGKRQRQKM